MNKAILAIVIIVIIGGIYLSSRQKEADVSRGLTDNVMMKKENEGIATTTGYNMSDKSSAGSYSGEILAGTSAPLLDFIKSDYDTALASGKLVALYFYANWCPICKAEFPEAVKAFDSLTTDTVIGFRVNFNDSDTDPDEVALARQFGVAYQHTKVLVKDGKSVLKSPESWDAARYESEIAKALI